MLVRGGEGMGIEGGKGREGKERKGKGNGVRGS